MRSLAPRVRLAHRQSQRMQLAPVVLAAGLALFGVFSPVTALAATTAVIAPIMPPGSEGLTPNAGADGAAAAPLPLISAGASILMYHHIAQPPRNLGPADGQYFVDPSVLDQQIYYTLSNGYNPVSLTQLVDSLTGGPALPSKAVVFTVDDGWQDFYRNGMPIAKKYAIPVTLFAIADADKNGYMDPSERWALAHSGFDVEAHTLTHPFLTRLSSAGANSEIVNSRKALEKELGLPVQLFAYPYGDFNKAIQAMVLGAGYKAAFAAGPTNDEDNQHLLSLPRVMVSRYDTPTTFASKLADYRWARTHFAPMPAPPPVLLPVAVPAPAPVQVGDGTGAMAGVPTPNLADPSSS